MMYRAKVTKVTAAGAWVLVPELVPGFAFGPCDIVGSPPTIGALVLAVNLGSETAPDIVVLTGGGLSADGSLKVGGLTVKDTGAGFIELKALGNNVRIYAGHTTLDVKYGSTSASYIEGGRATANADPATSLATKGYIDAIKSALAASSSFADFQTRVAAL